MTILEQLEKKISGVSESGAQKVKNFADVTKINNMIAEKEKRISELFLLIGQSYFEINRNNSNCDEKERIMEINSLMKEIEDDTRKINEIKGIKRCEHCSTQIPINAVFCNVCGKKLNTDRCVEEEEYRCPSCNHIVEEGSLYCNQCGTKVQKRIKALVKEKNCPVCHSTVEDGNLFCNQCGAKVVEEMKEREGNYSIHNEEHKQEKYTYNEEPVVRKCPKCRNEVDKENLYCTFCGTKFPD